ncbi:MAG TPA: TetR/AcrR family transcriptional regulator [Phenylobacterium sp.]|jgi:AcrR family transcriptional regulator|uniref:TetR/AcrR family transcriptional regulator n=1 Tax=Phenylobacterium sp. TaxID=1871053 RepID=UPI002C4ABEDC|nr:TetR/AcrR family transcriptional regulator [Phenylobacterium sp.]HXA39848.1 TetR/AcrR family transcriptional regulator [Phenylobacterium sp.]
MTPRPYRARARAEATEQTRLRIIAAAAAVLRAKGAGGFSLESVAKEAGVTRLTVYNQFGSRRALLEAVFDDRAAHGGLHRLAEAMTDPEPLAAMRRLVEIFCGFWSFDRGSLASLHAATSGDAEFEAGLQSRNERRRKAISVLVGRLASQGAIDPDRAKDLTDLLFVLTSFQTYAEIAADRTPEAACALIQTSVLKIIARG